MSYWKNEDAFKRNYNLYDYKPAKKDLELVDKIRETSTYAILNKNAKFQAKILHPSAAPKTPVKNILSEIPKGKPPKLEGAKTQPRSTEGPTINILPDVKPRGKPPKLEKPTSTNKIEIRLTEKSLEKRGRSDVKTINVTNLKPIIPQIDVQTISKVWTTNKMPEIPKITLPNYNTRIELNIHKDLIPNSIESEGIKSVEERKREKRLIVLKSIRQDLLISKKQGTRKEIYQLHELRDILANLGMTSTGNKNVLVDIIKTELRKAGLLDKNIWPDEREAFID